MKRARSRPVFVPGRLSAMRLHPKDILCVRLLVMPSEKVIQQLRKSLGYTHMRCLVVGPDVEITKIRGR